MTDCMSAHYFNAHSRLVQLALVAGLVVLTGIASAQDLADAADAAKPAATGGACVATASLGALSLAPASPDLEAAAGSSPEGAKPPVYEAVTPEGFDSLASDVPALVASCIAAGMPAAATADAAADNIAAAAGEPAPAPEVVPERVAETLRASVAPAEPRPTPAPRPRQPPAEALKTWWPAAEAGKLNLRFAGEAAFGEAIALLFDAPFSDPSSLAQHVEVKNRAGKTVEAKWQIVTSNPQMVALRVPPGLYEVRVGESLAAANGLRFQRTAEGKIFVR